VTEAMYNALVTFMSNELYSKTANAKILFKIHLYLVCAAFFLVILGVTGSIIAFEEDAELWLNPRSTMFRCSHGRPAAFDGELIEK